MATTAAQDEYNSLVANNTARGTLDLDHRDDPELSAHDDDDDDDDDDLDLDEETIYQNAKIEAAMRTTTGASELKLPPASFDSGRSTGVKGVIADARSFETARKTTWIDKAKSARRSILGIAGINQNGGAKSESETDDDTMGGPGSDEESFLQQWRESRRRELEREANRAVRTRRTSPSVRVYGRLDEVDASGYLDAIEKVGRETKVVVFVYDHECDVSAAIESALAPLVKSHSTIHFVKIHYDEIEFDNAAVPALLAYHDQGDLFANLTGIIEMMPDEESFGTRSLQRLLERHQVL